MAVSGARLLSGGFSVERRDKSYKSEGVGCEQCLFCLVFLCVFAFFLLEFSCFPVLGFCYTAKRISYTYTYIPSSPSQSIV